MHNVTSNQSLISWPVPDLPGQQRQVYYLRKISFRIFLAITLVISVLVGKAFIYLETVSINTNKHLLLYLAGLISVKSTSQQAPDLSPLSLFLGVHTDCPALVIAQALQLLTISSAKSESPETVAKRSQKKTVTQIPTPTTPRQVRKFLGTAGFYRLQIPGLATLAAQLYPLTKEGEVFVWTPDHQKAFKKMKKALLMASLCLT